MDEATQRMIAGIAESQKHLLGMTRQVMLENATLQGICGCLIAEIARMDQDSEDRLAKIIAGLHGSAAGAVAGTELQAVTRSVEIVCSIAEKVLPIRGSSSGRSC